MIENRPIINGGNDKRHHAGERAIVFRFAHYLQNLIDDNGGFEDYNLDCEYNRNGTECKSLPSFPKGTYPDIIIHQRGSNDYNLLVIEVKTYWNDDTERDKRKLKDFTAPNGKYKFSRGISLLLTADRSDVQVLDCTFNE